MNQSHRRPLKFETLEEAVRDAEMLLAQGYEKAGQWDLAQCCHHLAEWMKFPLDGFPRLPFPMNLMAPVLRRTVAPGMLKKILDSGEFPAGGPTDRQTIPSAGGNDAEGVAQLKHAVHRLLNHEGPLQPSPLFGMLDKETLIRLHRIHTAHHLSFLIPKT